MSVFTEAWTPMLQQQQLPPGSPEGRGAGSRGRGGRGSQEGPGSEDPSEGFTGAGGAADNPGARGGGRRAGSPEGARAAPAAVADEREDRPAVQVALEALDPAAQTFDAPVLQDDKAYEDDIANVRDFIGTQLAARAKSADDEAEMARMAFGIAPGIGHLMGAFVEQSIKGKEQRFAAKVRELATTDVMAAGQMALAGPGPNERGGGPEAEGRDVGDLPEPAPPPKPAASGAFDTMPEYESPIDRAARGGDQAVSEFLTTMRENVKRASARLARI